MLIGQKRIVFQMCARYRESEFGPVVQNPLIGTTCFCVASILKLYLLNYSKFLIDNLHIDLEFQRNYKPKH